MPDTPGAADENTPAQPGHQPDPADGAPDDWAGGGLSWGFDLDLEQILAAVGYPRAGDPADLDDPADQDASLAAERELAEDPRNAGAKPVDLTAIVADQLPAGPGLAGWLANAAATADLSDWDLPGIAAAYHRVASWAHAGELNAVAAIASRAAARAAARGGSARVGDDGRPDQVTAEAGCEVSLGLVMSQYGGEAWAGLAVDLEWKLPATAAALRAGEIDLTRARIIADATGRLDDDTARAVEAMVLAKAGSQTTGQLHAALRRAVIKADPDGADERRKQAERSAKVSLYPDRDGTAALVGSSLPGTHAAAAMARLTAMARALKASGAGGGIDFLRAHVFIGLLLGTAPLIPPPPGAPPDTDPPDTDPPDSDPPDSDPPDSDPPPHDPGGPADGEPAGGSHDRHDSHGGGGPDSGNGRGPGSGDAGGPGGGNGTDERDRPGRRKRSRRDGNGASRRGASGAHPPDTEPADSPGTSPDPPGNSHPDTGTGTGCGTGSRSDGSSHAGPGDPFDTGGDWRDVPPPGDADAPDPAQHPPDSEPPPDASHYGNDNPADDDFSTSPEPPWPPLPPTIDQTPPLYGHPPPATPARANHPPDPPGPAMPTSPDPPGTPDPGSGTRDPHDSTAPAAGPPGAARGQPPAPPPGGKDNSTRRPVPGLLDLTLSWNALTADPAAAARLGRIGPITTTQALPLAAIAALDPATQWRVILTDNNGHATAVERVRHHRASHDHDRAPSVMGRVTVTIPASTLDRDQPADHGIRDAILRAARRANTRAQKIAAADTAAGGCAHTTATPRYRPTTRIREHVEARDQTCRQTRCRQPAWQTDLDHTQPHHKGGRTCPCNLGGHCRTHHKIKQLPGWTLTQPHPGHFEWTTPAGRTYTTEPDTHPT